MLAFPPDTSFLIQIVSFLVLFVGLKNLIFDPTMKVIEERERRTAGAAHAAHDLKDESARHAAEYDAKLQAVRAELSAATEAARVEIEGEERRIVNGARNSASEQLTTVRARLSEQATQARQKLAGDASGLAAQVFERVVGRPGA